jgi:hypothetical protein
VHLLLSFNPSSRGYCGQLISVSVLYESGEGMDEYEMAQMDKQLKKVLQEVKIVHNTRLDISDDSQDFRLQLSVIHRFKFHHIVHHFQ